MIYRSEDIYKKIKGVPEILNEQEFMRLYKPELGPSSITDEVLLVAFSDLRLALGQNFKLDHICFLFGNGCSMYAGSKSTEKFSMKEAIDKASLESIADVVDKVSGWTMEEQLNAMLTVQEYFGLVDEVKKKTVDKIIDAIKAHLLIKYVDSVKYRELHLHEVMILKLRASGCLNKVNFYTPNYDLAVEYVLDKLGIEYANGFSGFINRKFDPKSLLTSKITRLVKIHGSVNWVFDEADKVIKEIQPKFPEDGSIVTIGTS